MCYTALWKSILHKETPYLNKVHSWAEGSWSLSIAFCCSTTSEENHSPNQRTVITTSHVKMASSGHAVLLSPAEDHGLDNFGLEFTASDFGIDDTMSEGRGSISSTGTPILPDLSSTSSFEDLPLDFSSDASGLARENFSTSTNLYQGL